MNWQRVVERFKDLVLAGELTSAGSITVYESNTVHTGVSSGVWLEIGLSQKSQMSHTETEAVYQAFVNCIVCVPSNTGTVRSNRLAADLASLFSPRIASQAVFALETGEIVFVRRVEQLAGMVIENVYKTNVRIAIDVYVTE